MEIRKDCFAYNIQKNRCEALNETYCKKEKCKFYKNRNIFVQK